MTTRVTCSPELTTFQREVDQFLSGLFRQPARTGSALNIYSGQDDDGYYLEALIPGLDPASLDIRVEDHVLSLSGKRSQPEVTEGTRWHLKERASGEFTHRLRIPRNVDAGAVTADYSNGILNLTLPKAASAKPRQIEVRLS